MKYNFLGRQDIPVEAVMPAGPQQTNEYVVGAMLAIALAFGMCNLLKRGDARLLICMAAGLLSSAAESHAMGMVKFIYPPIGQNILYTGFGKPVPVFMGMEYCVYFGVFSYVYLTSPLSAKWSAKAFWICYFTIVLIETVMEIFSVDQGLWAYYGDQPLLIADFPVYVAFLASATSIISGATGRMWFERVKGPMQLLWILVGPAILLGVLTVIFYPVSFGLQSGGGVAPARIGGVLTILIAMAITYAVVRLSITFRLMPERVGIQGA